MIPYLKKLLMNDKRFKLRILMTHPVSDAGQRIIQGRVRFRDEAAEFHTQEIKSQLDQFVNLKTEVDKDWEKTQDGAKLDLQVRLYEHLPFGPQVHIGEERSYY